MYDIVDYMYTNWLSIICSSIVVVYPYYQMLLIIWINIYVYKGICITYYVKERHITRKT